MEMFKCFSRKRFAENIYNMFLGIDIFQLDVLFSHLFIEKMILDLYMFGC